MATAPNDPFQNSNADPSYGSQNYDQQTPKKSNKGCLIGCGIAGVLGLLVCCGGGGAAIMFGLSAFGEIAKAELQGNPVIVEHIGEIESVDFSFGGTAGVAEENPGAGNTLVFDIKGDKGSGQVVIVQNQNGGGPIESAKLLLPDGTELPIDLGAGPSEAEEMDFDLDEMFESGEIQTGDASALSDEPVAVP